MTSTISAAATGLPAAIDNIIAFPGVSHFDNDTFLLAGTARNDEVAEVARYHMQLARMLCRTRQDQVLQAMVEFEFQDEAENAIEAMSKMRAAFAAAHVELGMAIDRLSDAYRSATVPA